MVLLSRRFNQSWDRPIPRTVTIWIRQVLWYINGLIFLPMFFPFPLSNWSLFNFTKAFVCRIVNLRLLWHIFFAECNSQGDSNRSLIHKKTKLLKARKIPMKFIFILTFSTISKERVWSFVFGNFSLIKTIKCGLQHRQLRLRTTVWRSSKIFANPQRTRCPASEVSKFWKNKWSCFFNR